MGPGFGVSSLTGTLGVLLLLISFAVSQSSPFNRFINPPAANSVDNPVWYLGDQQLISWKSVVGNFNVTFWQQDPKVESARNGGTVFLSTPGIPATTNFTWSVQRYTFNLTFSNVFFFWINAGTSDAFSSNYFNISDSKPPESKSSSLKSTASSTSSATTTTSIVQPRPTAPSKAPQHRLKPGEKAGIGVGVAFGALILILGTSALTWFMLRKQKQPNRPAPQENKDSSTELIPSDHEYAKGPILPKGSAENFELQNVPHYATAHELPSTPH